MFLPATLVAAFLLVPRELRGWLLIAASLAFYAVAGAGYALLLAGSVVYVFGVTASPATPGSRVRLLLAISVPLAALLVFKYMGFVLGTLASVPGLAEPRESLLHAVALPAGISFYTFTLVAFAVDRFRGEVPQPRFRDFALYVTFFPHLVAGPILRYADVRGALHQLSKYRPTAADWSLAAGYFGFGLIAKLLLADGIAAAAAPFARAPDTLRIDGAMFSTLAYSFQIYFDFYGYSLMAIGLAGLFGFRFPDNFARPYESLNPREFWRRWHITLSFWIRDYLYVPLGGNRHYIRNMVLVFSACGLWHGAGWNFVAWGLFHAALVILYRAVRPVWDRLNPLGQRILTFALVSIGWTLFRYDFGHAAELFRSLVGAGGDAAPNPAAWLWLGVAAVVCFTVRPEPIVAWAQSAPRGVAGAYGVALGSLVAVSLLFLDRSTDFIYFRF